MCHFVLEFCFFFISFSKQPFVLFGTHASESNLNKVCTAGGKSSGDGLAGQSSHTMVRCGHFT